MSGDIGAEPRVSARAEILERVRASLGDLADGSVSPPVALPGGEVSPDTFAARVQEYRATVTRCPLDGVAASVAAICARHGARRIAVSDAVAPEWLPDGIDVLRDAPPLDTSTLAGVDGALTGSALGIVETGTVALDGGAASGRRALSLLPDLHLCVVDAASLVATMHEAIAALAPAIAAGRPITFVSGPSATSDIELQRVEGVHGPRRLEVLLVG